MSPKLRYCLSKPKAAALALVAMGSVAHAASHESSTTMGKKEALTMAENQAGNAITRAIKSSTQADWMKRTNIELGFKEDFKPRYALETVQPLFMNKDDTVFWQGRLAHRNADYTYNFGLGFRRLLDQHHWMWGLNAFYDRTSDYDHKRWGVGGELFGQFATFRANIYRAISGKKTTKTVDSVSYYEQALDGYDYSVEVPLPHMPWARAEIGASHWDGVTASDHDAFNFGVRLFPWAWGDLFFGGSHDDVSGTKLTFDIAFHAGEPKSIQHTANMGRTKQKFIARDLDKMRLEKVWRHNDIVVESTQSNSSTGIIISRGT